MSISVIDSYKDTIPAGLTQIVVSRLQTGFLKKILGSIYVSGASTIKIMQKNAYDRVVDIIEKIFTTAGTVAFVIDILAHNCEITIKNDTGGTIEFEYEIFEELTD